MKQTAVEWLEEQQAQLFNQVKNGEIQIDEYEYYLNLIIEQAKEIEKQQITDAYRFGLEDDYVMGSREYYNKTFKSE
jgi:hypothetical protein